MKLNNISNGPLIQWLIVGAVAGITVHFLMPREHHSFAGRVTPPPVAGAAGRPANIPNHSPPIHPPTVVPTTVPASLPLPPGLTGRPLPPGLAAMPILPPGLEGRTAAATIGTSPLTTVPTPTTPVVYPPSTIGAHSIPTVNIPFGIHNIAPPTLPFVGQRFI